MMQEAAGILLIDKPPGPTSHDIVAQVRRAIGTPRVGHTGTLDPIAEGLLILCVGSALRLVEHLQRADKTYEATLRLGVRSDTLDRTGKLVFSEPPVLPPEEELRSVLASVCGTRPQVVPAYSAVRVAGERLHRLARQGKPVPELTREITISECALLQCDSPLLRIRVRCSSGTYIRSLCVELGERLGSDAIMHDLRRIRIGAFSVQDALAPERLQAGRWQKHLLPVACAVTSLPPVIVSEEGDRRLRHGAPLYPDHLAPETGSLPPAGSECRLEDQAGRLLAIGLVEEYVPNEQEPPAEPCAATEPAACKRIRPHKVLVRPENNAHPST